MKKVLLILSITISICLCVLLVKQAFRVCNSISIWNNFQEYVLSGQPIQECSVVKKDVSLINLEAKRISSTRVDIRRTIQAHVLEGTKKVVLADGYIDIEDGQIIHVKFL